jgi:hypothetical protein
MFANSQCSNVPSNGPFGWDNRTALSARKVSQDDRLNSAAYRRSLASPQSKQKHSASVIVRRNSLVILPEFTRSTTLRLIVLAAGLFAAFIVALLGFIYLKTLGNLTMRSDRMIASQMGVFTDYRPSGGWTRSEDLGRNCRGVKCGITRAGFSR